EEEGRALVGREAPREADGEHVRVRRIAVLEQAIHVRLAALVAEVLLANAFLHEREHPRLEVLADAPEDVVRKVGQVLQRIRLLEAAAPAATEEAVEC